MVDAPRVLFVPVSGPFGMGEFARCSAIAAALPARWPNARVHFVLSRAAPYAAGTPFPKTLLPSSATFHSAQVIELMRRWRPHVVVFDSAGRTAQLKEARAQDARIVYISARRRQRRKAFRVRWMRLIDEHWIAYPKFVAGELGVLERLKLAALGRPTVRYLDVIMAPAAGAPGEAPSSTPIRSGTVLVIPGGGTGHPGAAGGTQAFLDAATQLAQAGFETRFVGPVLGDSDRPRLASLTMAGALPQAELVDGMRRARLVISNGGSTLLQAIACGAAVVAAPIAGDQPERIRRCVKAGAAVRAALDSADIARRATVLLHDEPARSALAGRAVGLALADGIEVALDALAPFMDD